MRNQYSDHHPQHDNTRTKDQSDWVRQDIWPVEEIANVLKRDLSDGRREERIEVRQVRARTH
jgi:hypothetical protein